jgi:hypothetical protein
MSNQREIKFRAWDKRKHAGTSGMNYDAQDSGHWNDFLSYPRYYTIQQYTGVKDINGNEIYEGDIVKIYDSYNSKVIFDKGEFRASNHEYCLRHYASSSKVIGNIFENPKLLIKKI